MPRRSLLAAAIFPILLVGAVTGVEAVVRTSASTLVLPAASPLAGLTSEILNRATPDAAPTEELALGRVTIQPGASIPPHEHPGTQLATILSGNLTYTVLTGTVGLTRRSPGSALTPAPLEEGVDAGETTLLRPGDSVTERLGALHTARNDGDVPVVILLATLFRAGEPRTIVASPIP